jgi:hypothetical protein
LDLIEQYNNQAAINAHSSCLKRVFTFFLHIAPQFLSEFCHMPSNLELVLILLAASVTGVVLFRLLHAPPMLAYLTISAQ